MGDSPQDAERAGRELEQLIDQHARLMASAIRRICRRPDLVADIEQEVHLALYKRLLTGKKIEYPTSYVYRVALNTASTVLRRLTGREEEAEDDALESAARSDSEAGDTERKILLEQVLAELPVEQRAALRGYLAGFNHGEVAKIYGWTESVARHRDLPGARQTAQARRGGQAVSDAGIDKWRAAYREGLSERDGPVDEERLADLVLDDGELTEAERLALAESALTSAEGVARLRAMLDLHEAASTPELSDVVDAPTERSVAQASKPSSPGWVRSRSTWVALAAMLILAISVSAWQFGGGRPRRGPRAGQRRSASRHDVGARGSAPA